MFFLSPCELLENILKSISVSLSLSSSSYKASNPTELRLHPYDPT